MCPVYELGVAWILGLLPEPGRSIDRPLTVNDAQVLLTVEQAALLMGCSKNAIQHRVRAHRLGACVVREGRRTFIHRGKLEALMERRATR